MDMHNHSDSRKSPAHRLKIAAGQLQKTVSMLEGGAYCIDTIHQLQAVREALRKAEQEILHDHLNTCVVDQIKQGKSSEVIAEVMKVVTKS